MPNIPNCGETIRISPHLPFTLAAPTVSSHVGSQPLNFNLGSSRGIARIHTLSSQPLNCWGQAAYSEGE